MAYEPELLADEKVPLSNMSLHTSYLLWVVVGILITAMFCLFLYQREKRLAANMQSRVGESVKASGDTPQRKDAEGLEVSVDWLRGSEEKWKRHRFLC